MWDSLNEIGAQLKRNKLRTALTGFAVGWGVLMLIFLLGIGTGLRNGTDMKRAAPFTFLVTTHPHWRNILEKLCTHSRYAHSTSIR